MEWEAEPALSAKQKHLEEFWAERRLTVTSSTITCPHLWPRPHKQQHRQSVCWPHVQRQTHRTHSAVDPGGEEVVLVEGQGPKRLSTLLKANTHVHARALPSELPTHTVVTQYDFLQIPKLEPGTFQLSATSLCLGRPPSPLLCLFTQPRKERHTSVSGTEGREKSE